MIEEVNQKLDHKLALNHLSTRLKQVLNPTIREGEFVIGDNVGVKLITDISQDNFQSLSFSVKSFLTNEFETKRKTAYTIGYITNEPSLWASNLGSLSFLNIGYIFENNRVCVVLVPSEDFNILKTEAEVFISDDNKNHVVSIDYVTDVEHDQYQKENIYLPIEGEVNSNFYYKIEYIDGETVNYRYIEPGKIDDNPIDSIRYSNHAKEAEKLNHNIELIINNNDSSQPIRGRGTIETDKLYSNIDVFIDTEPIIDAVKELIEYPVADFNNVIGGISLIDPENNKLGTNQFPILLQNVGNEEYGAYVDINGLKINGGDIHRYSDMSLATGGIVQYIGQTTPLYIRGYFYQYTPTNFNASTLNEKWEFITTAAATGQAIADYNIKVDCLISSGELKFEMVPENVENWTISDNSIFIISQNNSELARLDYANVKSTFGIKVKDSYLSDTDNTLILNLTIPSGAEAWRQKNVQPMLKVGSPLVFQGVVEAEQGETDIEALNRAVTEKEIGYFYIVKPSHQEYFWDGESWEFVGDIFDPYTEGDGISINSTHDISVKYDNDTIKKNGSGNLYVDGILTDTQADWNETNTSSAAYINNKPSIPAAQVNADWNASSGVAEILHKPTIPTVNDSVVVFDTSGVISDKFAEFTLNSATDTQITIVEGNNITLTPDISNNKLTINANNTTYSDFAGSTHGLVPAPGSGDTDKFLKADGSWDIPSGTGLTGVSFNGTSATVTSGVAAITASVGDVNVIETVKVNGSSLTPDSNKAVDITVPANTDTTYNFTIGSTTYGDLSGTSLGSLDSETAVASGTTLSLVTTGEKDIWNNKQPAGNYKTVQTAVSDPTASSSTSTTFIDSISQDTNGVITVTKKTLPTYPTVPSNIVNTIDSKTGDFTVDSGNNSGSWNVNFTVDNNKKISGTVDHPTIPQGTVTSISTGAGLTTSDGNSITSSGTVKTKLDSETSLGTIGTTSKLYAVGVDSDGKLAVNVPWVNDNTTYSFKTNNNVLTVTPSSGSASVYAPYDYRYPPLSTTASSSANPYQINVTSYYFGYQGQLGSDYKYIDVSTQNNHFINIFVGHTGLVHNNLVKEGVCRIKNNSSSEESGAATIKISAQGDPTPVTLTNMYDADFTNGTGFLLANGKTLELVFTYWNSNDVTFNGGVNV